MGATRGWNRQRRLNVLIAGLIAVIAVLVTLLTTNGSDTSEEAESTGQAKPGASERASRPSPLDQLARRQPGDPQALGRRDAPVVLVTYEDFRCPFCAKFATETAPKLRERYVDTGKLRIEWRDFPIFGQQSKLAAKAGRAAARQGRFWEFHDVVYAHAPERGHPDLNQATLVGFAKEAGVPDIARFEADLADPAIAQTVQRDYTQAAQLGVSSTPTFVVNGKPIVGAQPLPAFVETIEQALAESAGSR